MTGWPQRTLSAAEADGRAATSERRQINEAWSVSHRQPELDLIVSFVELDERTAAIDTAGRGLEFIEPWPDRLVDLGGFAVQVTAQEPPTR